MSNASFHRESYRIRGPGSKMDLHGHRQTHRNTHKKHLNACASSTAPDACQKKVRSEGHRTQQTSRVRLRGLGCQRFVRARVSPPVSPRPGVPPGCTRRGCAHPPHRCSSPSATGPPAPARRRRGAQLPVGAVGVHQRVARWTWRPLPLRRDPWTRWAMRGWRRMTSLLGAQLRANQSSLGRPVDLRVRMRSPVSGATPPYITYVRRKQGRVPDRPTG